METFTTQDVLTDQIITWVFEEDSYSPVAKLYNGKSFSIINDHLGTPTEMYDHDGNETWHRTLNANGKVLKETGNASCPFLFQGQYYDSEIGLAYNRFRYYDPEDGRYISQDPIGLLSGEFGFYNYVEDTNGWLDVFGLAKSYGKKKNNPLSEKEKFRKSLQDIKDGNGSPRLDDRGRPKEYKGRENANWVGAIEFEVDGNSDNNNRILKRTRTTTKGDIIVDYGFTNTHYKKITTDIDMLTKPE